MEQSALCALDTWFQTPLGEAVSDAFVEQLQQLPPSLLSQLSGETLFQIGACGHQPWLDLLPYQNKWIMSSLPASETIEPIHVYGLPKKLPLDNESVNCVVAPLTLEMMNWANHPLDEIDRILKPMGYWIIYGVNTWSLWGLAMRMGLLSCHGSVKGRPVSVFRLKHALLHRGYDLAYLSPFYYIPPINHPKLIQRLEILNELGKMISPCPGGFYCMIVQKYVSHLLKPARRRLDWGYIISEPNFQPVS